MKSKTQKSFLKGVSAHKRGNLSVAKRHYQNVLLSQPNHPDTNHNYGLILAAQQDSEHALLHFAAAISVMPRHEQFWESYIRALLSAHRFGDVSVALQKAADQSLTDKFLAKLCGLETYFFKDLGRFQEAERSCLKTVELLPHMVSGYSRLAWLLKSQGKLDDAIEAYQIALEVDSSDAAIHIDLGNILKDLGRLHEAELSYRKALELAPASFIALNNLGTLLKADGRTVEALKLYRRALDVDSDSAPVHYNLGNCLAQIGRDDEAMKYFEAALSLDPSVDKAIGGVGRLLLKQGNHKEGLAKLRLSEGAISLESERFTVI